MRFRQIKLLLHAVAQPDAEPLAATEGDQRLGQLIAGAELVGPRVSKVGQTRHPVRLGLNQHHHRGDRQDHHQREAEQADTTEEQHGRRSAHHYHGRTEVRLHEQQTGHRQQHDERLEEAHPAFTNFLLLTDQVAGKEDHHKHLGDFRRLHVERAEADPAHRTVHLASDSRHQYQEQQAERTEQHHPAQALPGGNRDHHGHAAGAQADEQINQVTGHHVQRVARLHRSNFRRRRGNHHQAKAEQRQATDQHREVQVDTAAADEWRWIRLDHTEDHDKHSTACANTRPRSS